MSTITEFTKNYPSSKKLFEDSMLKDKAKRDRAIHEAIEENGYM
jgi:hypothetical protein